MNSIIFAVKHAGRHSLVLLDELGAGTDPQEGSALAQAVLAFLHKKGCMLIATTHIGELKAFAARNDGFENASMEFNAATLTPTYNLIMGVAEIERMTLSKDHWCWPAEIINDAQGYMNDDAVKIRAAAGTRRKERAKAASRLKQLRSWAERAHGEARAERVAEKAAEKRKRN
jgi:DNA mismatch repair protein MutS2